MRRRPSGSGEDDDGTNSAVHSAPEHAEKSKEVVKSRGRASVDKATIQERKRVAEMIETPAREQETPRQRSSTTQPPSEKTALEDQAAIKEESNAMAEYFRKQRARLRSPWACSLLTLATTICAFLVLLTMVQSFLSRQLDPKGCVMPWMYPSFARFSDFDTEHTRFASKYSLYLYREGGVDEDIRVKGIPVLFIPGNAGSYKQVRPMAAQAAYYFRDDLRQDQEAVRSGKRPLDFFSVDFNEDITAFHGQTLLDQAEYLNDAVAYILSLYHNPHRSLREPGLPDPTSVIILGHSMGGVVARTMLRTSNYQPSTVNTIVTLSAPHARAPVSFDSDMVAAYKDINDFWRQSYDEEHIGKNLLADVTLVSIAGGGLDTMVPSEYTDLSSLVPGSNGFTVFTSTIPNVWTGSDHLAIMWCDQFRKSLVRALYDVVDVRRPSQTRPQSERIQALRKRLLTGMEPVIHKSLPHAELDTLLTIEDNSNAIMSGGERLVLTSLGASRKVKAHVLPIPAKDTTDGGKFTLLTNQRLDIEGENRTLDVLVCNVFPLQAGFSSTMLSTNIDLSGGTSGSTRLACKNAASDTVLLPASTNVSENAFDNAPPFCYLQYALSDLSEHQFVAVVDTSLESVPGWVVAEFSTGSDSTLVAAKGHHQLLSTGLRISLPSTRPMMTDIKVPELHSTLLAYTLQLSRSPCGEHEELFAPLLRQYMVEPYESKYFPNVERANVNVHGVSPYMPPRMRSASPSDGLSLQIWTDPTCDNSIEMSLKVDVLGSAGKLVMRYRTVFAAFPLLVVAIVLRKQFKIYDTTGVFMSFSESMDQCLRTSLPMVFTALTFLAVSLAKANQGSWARGFLSRSNAATEADIDFNMNDLMLGSTDPFFWFLIPLFGLISIGVCIALNYAVLAVTQVFALVYSQIRAVSLRNDEGRRTSTSFAVTTPQQRVATTGLLLILVMTVIPYQFAYMVLCIVQVATCVRALRLARDTHSGRNYNFYNYTHSMLTLMLWILPINLPVLIVWVHNLAVHWLTPFSTHHNLLSVLPYILLVEMMSTGHMIPRAISRVRYVTNVLIFALAVYAAVYGVTYAYRLHHLVNGLCAWLFLIHLANGPLSLAKLSQWTSYGRSGGHVKKRP